MSVGCWFFRFLFFIRAFVFFIVIGRLLDIGDEYRVGDVGFVFM